MNINCKNNKILSYISLARKSGNLIVGFDCVKSAIKFNKVKLIILTCDISERTKRKVIELVNDNKNVQIVTLELSMLDIYNIISRKVAVMSFSNDNFSTAIIKLLEIEK